jgi:isoquinoline 1-oxidoreductase beta subunit
MVIGRLQLSLVVSKKCLLGNPDDNAEAGGMRVARPLRGAAGLPQPVTPPVGPATGAGQGLSRRIFLQTAAVGGGGLLLHCSLPSLPALPASAATLVGAAGASPPAGQLAVTPWVRVTPDNVVTIIVSQAEIGQGISTTLPAILADELRADWQAVRLETAPFAAAYRNPLRQWMFTGNSESVQSFYDLMRQMGAAAREMLIQAAASRFGVAPEACRADRGTIVHAASGRRLTFGDVAAAAARLPVPASPRLLPDAELQLVGRSLPRVDVPEKVDGSARFGIDLQLPGMLVAAVRTAPTLAGRLRAVDPAPAAGMPGVRAVVPLDNGVAVVADTWWQARTALGKLRPDFEPGPGSGPDSELSSAGVLTEYRRRLESGPWATPVAAGNVEAAMAAARAAARVVTADYLNPFLAHATMEPMNCIVSLTADSCEVWAPTQGQELAVVTLEQRFGLRADQVRVNRSPYAGGAFGRRLLPDFIVQAAVISKAAGRPVKLIWDREEDMRRDRYRPATMVRLTAALDAAGLPAALAARVVSPTILLPVFPAIEPLLRDKGIDPSALEGMLDTIYELPNRHVDFHLLSIPVPTSVMRTTGYGPNVTALESFVDELAHAAKADPYRYRRRLLARNARALAVLDRAAALAGWGKPLPAGHGRGIAVAEAFGTFISQVAEVAVEGPEVRVLRVTSAVDCGRVLDPGIATGNIEAGVVFGLSYCKSEVTFAGGAVVPGNFDAYELPYLAETPELVTELVPGSGKLGGIAETGPVAVPAALLNAVFAATGRRLRELPLGRQGLRLGVVRPPKGKGYA